MSDLSCCRSSLSCEAAAITSIEKLAFIPRHFCQQQAHAAKIRDAGKNQTGTDKTRKPDEVRIHKVREQHARENNRSSSDSHLAFEAYDFYRAAVLREVSPAGLAVSRPELTVKRAVLDGFGNVLA